MAELPRLALLHLSFLTREDACGVFVAELREDCPRCREIKSYLKEQTHA